MNKMLRICGSLLIIAIAVCAVLKFLEPSINAWIEAIMFPPTDYD